ncbi:MAG: DUF6456 domain-containing protein [Oceanicaulis sp.]
MSGWLKRLDGPGRVLAPLPGGRKGWGVFAGADRRRRPLAVVKDAEARAAISDGALEKTEAGYALTGAGRSKAAREGAGEGLAFLAQHGGLKPRAVMEPSGERTAIARPDSPLKRYLEPRGGKPALLDAVHAAAADIFVRDYERSALQSRVTQDWSGTPGGETRSAPKDRAEAPVTRLDAQARVMDALDAAGPGFDRLILNVLIRETGMLAAERDLGWPERTGAAALKMALDRLAIHYRLKRPERAAL